MAQIRTWLEMLQSPEEEMRLQGLKGLTGDGAAAHLDRIYTAFGDASWRVRKEAAEIFLALSRAGELAGEIVELLHAQENAGLRNTAVEILVRLGQPAVPFLLEELSCSDQDVRKFVLDVLGDIGNESCITPMVKALQDPDDNVRAAAAENLGRLRAPQAVEALVDAMTHKDLLFRFTILEALGQIGAPVPLQRLLLFQDDKLLRKALFDCLGRVGGEDAVPLLVEGLGDPMRNVREAAALALVRVGASSEETVIACLSRRAGTSTIQSVAELLDSSNPEVRRAAVALAGAVGDAAMAPRLLELVAEEELRDEAVSALQHMGNKAAAVLLDFWDRGDPVQKSCIAYLAGEAGCSEGIPLLRRGLASADETVQIAVARALGKLGAAEAIPQLVQCLNKGNEEVRGAAMEALCRLGEEQREKTLDALVPLLEADTADLRMCAVAILGRLDGEEAQRILAFALKDEAALVRRAAVQAFDGRAGEDYLQYLMLALTDEDAEVRRLAAEALGQSGGQQALPPLELALQDEDTWVRSTAVRALRLIGGKRAAQLTREALHDPIGLVSIAAMETLASIDPEGSLPLFIEALGHEDEEVVNAALGLLCRCGDKRQEWLEEASDRLLNDQRWEVRIQFVRTLAELQGGACRQALEKRLLIEGEALVREQIQEILTRLGDDR